MFDLGFQIVKFAMQDGFKSLFYSIKQLISNTRIDLGCLFKKYW